ncbi:MAG TPA: winged helix-turn-helix domain-containing protein, partial [Candidatus Angelobacter sp.]|nr:winged helix-turn-helix domain-containing protein [Candidatus Angelobacter sp.]
TDGLALLGRLRTEGLETPVMVLSARNRVNDRVESLNVGADDYVTKPFSFQELAARANALLRRKTDPALSILRVEDLELDPATRKAHRGPREIRLSPKEFDLLALLLRRGGNTVSRQELLRECWGHELEGDSNLVDVYVNYLRKKIDFPEDEKLIYTIRGEGYRLGKGPTNQKLSSANHQAEPARSLSSHSYPPAPAGELAGPSGNAALRAMVHSVTHDLAQPLTSLRCFLEVLSLDKNLPEVHANDLRVIEQQADRAIALTKGISALVRDAESPEEPWIPLDDVLNDILNDFNVLLNSGLLTLERHWDSSLHVSSSPILRQVVLLLLSKLAGRNTRPLLLTITAESNDERCDLRFTWKTSDSAAPQSPDGLTVLAKDLPTLEQMVGALGGEIVIPEHQSEVLLTLPAPPAPSPSQTDMVH